MILALLALIGRNIFLEVKVQSNSSTIFEQTMLINELYKNNTLLELQIKSCPSTNDKQLPVDNSTSLQERNISLKKKISP